MTILSRTTIGFAAILAVGVGLGQPAITVQPTNFDSVSLGASVGNRVLATGTAPLAYQWRLFGVPVAGQTKSMLALTNVQLSAAGDYTVLVTNLAGSITSRVVTLTVDPTFTKINTGPGEPKPVTDYGACPTWWDYDNDGFLDLFIADGLMDTSRNRLYHNNQDGTFTRITNVISTTLGIHVAGVVADYDNDGDEDLFVAGSAAPEFYRNDGAGSFTRLTKQQVGPALGDSDVTMEAAWVDYDRDGFLDLFRQNGQPLPSVPTNDCLYRNNADGTFTKMTTNEVGQIVNDHADANGLVWGDYDNDGWPDLLALTWTGKNLLYHNDGGVFRKVTDPNNSVAQQDGQTGGGAWGDYDNDGFLDLFVVGLQGPHTLHHNLAGLTFTNVAASAGIPTTHRGEDASWADYDNDGFLDLYITGDPPYPSLLLHNNGDGTFTSVDVGSPIHDSTSAVRLGIGWADYDNDGFLDLAVACYDAANLLFHNNGNSNHWLKAKLTGTASNRSAIGAKVRVHATIRGTPVWQMREITGNTLWCGGTPGLLAHFGLGDATNVDVVRIEWPSGLVQELHDVAPNRSLKITEHQAGITDAPSLTALRSASGSVQLTLTGQTNLLYVFEASTNLVRWTKIAVRTNLTGSVDFTDRFATNYAQRFYRGVVP